jgi:thiol-disulfide isomerase/thioredoxin
MKLKKELIFLQPVEASLYKHPLENSYLNTEIPNINWKIDSPHIIFFATPTCSSCHSALESFIDLQERHGKVPLKVILPLENENSYKFFDKYKKTVDIELTYYSQIPIKRFPTIIIIEGDTNVVYLGQDPISSYNIFKYELWREN